MELETTIVLGNSDTEGQALYLPLSHVDTTFTLKFQVLPTHC